MAPDSGETLGAAPSPLFPSHSVFALQRLHPCASLPISPKFFALAGREGTIRLTLSVHLPQPASEAGSVLIKTCLTAFPRDLCKLEAFDFSWALILGSFHPFSGEIVLKCRCDQGIPCFRPSGGSLAPLAPPRRTVGLVHQLCFRLPPRPSRFPGQSNPAASFLFPTRGPLTPEPSHLFFPSTVPWPLRSCSLPSPGQASAETPAPSGTLPLTPVPPL